MNVNPTPPALDDAAVSPRRRRRSLRVLAASTIAAAAVALGGCGGDASTSTEQDPSAAPSSPPTSSPTSTTSPTSGQSATSSATDEEALEAAPAEGGISDELADELADLANKLGYGPADRSFALIMVITCRDVAAGSKSFAEVVDLDVAGGAPRAKAEQMYEFVKTKVCPQVKPVADQAAPTADPNASGGAQPGGMRAMGVSAAAFPNLFKAGRQATCRAAEGVPLGTAAAYTLKGGATLCLDYTDREPLGDVQDSMSVVFNPPVPRATALRTVARLLPKDTKVVESLTGMNPDYAAKDGSCESVLYSSKAYQEHMSQYDSDEEMGITFDDTLNAMLYSDRQTADGSSSTFNGSVRFVSVTSGGHNFAYQSKDVTC